ncbi:MAG: flagellar biosynthesis protein FlhF [Candidatus Aminicenantes bacterium]|nr:flagellar biosynthesis protein FlhF [Candidatus Aminicenantes bacterium]
MQIKRFEARSMAEALGMIKKEFGPDAVILSARNLPLEKKLFGSRRKAMVEVTAATDNYFTESGNDNATHRNMRPQDVPEAMPQGAQAIQTGQNVYALPGGITMSKNIFNAMDRKAGVPHAVLKEYYALYHHLLDQEVAEDVALGLIEGVRSEFPSPPDLSSTEFKGCLGSAMQRQGVAFNRVRLERGRQKVVSLIGPTGVGKTTTLVKLAATASAGQRQKRVGLITLDIFRIAAISQLKVYARIIGAPLEIASTSHDLQASLAKFSSMDLVLIDTPGMSHRDQPRLNEVHAVLAKFPQIEHLLLLSAPTKDKDMNGIFKAFSGFGVSRLIFTKLDESTTFGPLLNQLIRSRKPASYFTNGQQVPEDLLVADASKLIDLVIDVERERRILSAPPETLARNLDAFEHMLEAVKRRVNPRKLSDLRYVDGQAVPSQGSHAGQLAGNR